MHMSLHYRQECHRLALIVWLLFVGFHDTAVPAANSFVITPSPSISRKKKSFAYWRHAKYKSRILQSRSESSSSSSSSSNSGTAHMTVDDAIMNRYACTRFEPVRIPTTTTTKIPATNTTSSSSLQTQHSPVWILEQAYQALDIARRAPSGFNIQPYKLLVVHSEEQKNAMSKFCCGHNAHRVRESVCTVLFLADRQVMQNWKDYQALNNLNDKNNNNNNNKKKKKSTLWKNLKTMGLLTMFSSGFPYLPQILAGPISFGLQLAMRMVSWITRSKLPVPTLTSSLTWSTKNTMLVAMAYMLACTSRGIATCPMEGYTTWGIRKELKIPRRYSIPLIVATGIPFHKAKQQTNTGGEGQDDVGMSHGPPSSKSSTPRFESDQVIYGNLFGINAHRGILEKAQ